MLYSFVFQSLLVCAVHLGVLDADLLRDALDVVLEAFIDGDVSFGRGDAAVTVGNPH